MYPTPRHDPDVLSECAAWSQQIERSLQSVVEQLNGFDGAGGEHARQGLLLVEQALRVGAAALQTL